MGRLRIGADGRARAFLASLHGCTGLSFADDSQYVWVGHQVGSRAVTLMDSETGQIALAVPNLAGIITSAAASQRQGIVALAAMRPDTKVVAFDLDQPQLPLEFATKGRADKLLVNPARKQLAWRENGDSQQVRLLDLTVEPLATVDIATDGASDIVYSADGEIIAINRSLGSTLHDAKTGERLVTLPGFRERPPPAYICEKILAIDEEHCIWAIVRRHPQADFCLARYAPDAQSATMIVEGLKDSFPFALSPDRTLLASVTPKVHRLGPYEIEVLEVPSGKQVARYGGHWNDIGKLAFSPDSRKLASVALMSDVVKIWSLDAPEPAAETAPAVEPPAGSE
jgi:WD40 repeat protein